MYLCGTERRISLFPPILEALGTYLVERDSLPACRHLNSEPVLHV